MAVLSLPDAHILHSRGWGPGVPASTRFRVEFTNEGDLVLYRAGMLGEKKAFFMGVDMLTMRIWTDNVRTGGGFIGGGFGVEGSMKGMMEAGVLNALTARNREYVMLAVVANEWNGAVRELVLGWRNTSEADLRDRINRALPAWGKAYVEGVMPRITSRMGEQEALATYEQLDIIQSRGLVFRKANSTASGRRCRRSSRRQRRRHPRRVSPTASASSRRLLSYTRAGHLQTRSSRPRRLGFSNPRTMSRSSWNFDGDPVTGEVCQATRTAA